MYCILFLVFSLASSEANGCFNRFPLKDTVETIKAIVQQYGTVSSDKDPDGTEWLNLLIEEDKDGFEYEGIMYHLNSNQFPPEQTFYFNQIQFLSTQSFVIPKQKKSSWKASVPDKTYLLSKISFTCPLKQRVCGLRCCPEANYVVQQLFIDKVGSRKLQEDVSVSHRNITYDLFNRNATCSYTFSYYDTSILRILLGHETTVYFNCPTGQSCCGLTCSPPPQMEEIRLSAIENHLWDAKKMALLGQCTFIFVLFFIVTYCNYLFNRKRTKEQSAVLPVQHNTKPQTSKYSRDKESLMDK